MLGLTGHRMVHRGTDTLVTAPQNLVNVHFPKKTRVTSMALHDLEGRPIYRKDISV